MGNCVLAFIVVWLWKEGVERPLQEPFGSDFGLYKCEACGKMVMGYDRENHAREAHKGKGANWVKER